MNDRSIYLDYAATTPLDQAVFKVMEPYFSHSFYNPSAIYRAAITVKTDLMRARQEIAQVLGVHFQEIIFCAGGSEANNLAIKGYLKNYDKSHVVVSHLEHDSVLEALKDFNYSLAKVKTDGIIDFDSLKNLINDQTNLVVVMLANNEIGTIQPIKKIADLVKEIRLDRLKRGINQPIQIFCDACQAGNYLDLKVNRLGVDMMSLNGSKIYGPKQSAVLYLKHGLSLKPLIDGGGQEYGLRSGTENVASSIGLAEALKKTQNIKKTEAERLQKLQKYFIDKVATLIPEISFNGSIKYRLPNNLNFSFQGQDNERLLFFLDRYQIMASAGSACSASNHKSSHVLAAIGLDDSTIYSSLRLTMGRQTVQADLDRTISVLVNYKKQL